jgi:L-2-hydroxycarboxylate dehydrogenase (NAD+)
MRINHADLRSFCIQVLEKLKVPQLHAEQTTDILMQSDMFDISSHGVARLKRYIKGIKDGIMRPDADIKIIEDYASSIVVDADNALGQPAAHFAMTETINRAKKTGVCVCTVRNSNHYGIAGYYSLMAEKEGLFGFSMTNASVLVVPTNGKDAVYGTNPIAFSCPSGSTNPIHFDMATSTVPRGKLEVYERLGKKMPLDWAVDENGDQTDDPTRVLKNFLTRSGGGLMPLGGYKGFGMGLLVEILSGVLSGSAFGMDTYKGKYPNLGHFFLAFDVSKFMSIEDFKTRMIELTRQLKSVSQPDKEVQMPGERSFKAFKYNTEHGVPIDDPVRKNLIEIGKEFGIDIEDKFF